MDDRFKQPVYVIENNKVVKKNMGEVMADYFPAVSALSEISMEDEWQIMCALENVPDFLEYKKFTVYYTNDIASEKLKYKLLLRLNQSFSLDHLTTDDLVETIDFLKSKNIIT